MTSKIMVVFQTKYEPHKEKRPTIIYKFEDKESLLNRLGGQLESIIDDYNIIITSDLNCKKCGIELDYDLYQYNRLCNKCDSEQ